MQKFDRNSPEKAKLRIICSLFFIFLNFHFIICCTYVSVFCRFLAMHANRLWRNQWSNISSYFSNQVAGLTRKVHLKSETWQVLRQFEMNLVNGIWWGLKRFQQLSEGVACCMFVDSFFATHHSAASFTFSFCFCFSFAISLHETLHICFAERALCVFFFFITTPLTRPGCGATWPAASFVCPPLPFTFPHSRCNFSFSSLCAVVVDVVVAGIWGTGGVAGTP